MQKRRKGTMAKSKQDLSRIVGANLKRLIKNSNRTQAEFACDFGVDERTVRRWISGGVEKLHVVDELADFFGVDRGVLLS
jgi:transcriptional regulator with XRE-family HTH domain